MSKCLVKRIVPFAAALILGLFVASFFVTVAAPKFNFKRNNYQRKNREVRNLERENSELRQRISRQQAEIENLKMELEPEIPLAPPPPPSIEARRVR